MSATTYKFTDGSIEGAMVPAATTLKENEVVIRRNIIDLSLQTLDAGEGDVAECLIVPAKTTVLWAGLRVITAETADGTCDLGYGGNPDEWGDALALDVANLSLGFIDGMSPVYFATADTIDITATADSADVDLDGAKIEVFAAMIKHVDTN